MSTPYDETNLRAHAGADIRMSLIVTGQQLPDEIHDEAVALLVELWLQGLTHGIEPLDWRYTGANLPRACLEALTLVKGRENDERRERGE